jgi:hypothetical protein
LTELILSKIIRYKSIMSTSPYIVVLVFPSRGLRHTPIYVRTDRGISSPARSERRAYRCAGISANGKRVGPSFS